LIRVERVVDSKINVRTMEERMPRLRIALAASVLAVLGLVSLAQPQPQDFSKVDIKTEKLADGLHVLFGAGGNIGVASSSTGAHIAT
jgi:hypothetical protein